MSDTHQPETGPADGHAIAGWVRFVSGFFPVHPGALADLLNAKQHPMMFGHHRARFLLSRARLMAMLFAILTPLWIPVDAWVFPQSIWQPLALGRIIASVGFAVLAMRSREATSLKKAHRALALLFLIPAAFYLFSHAVLAHASLDRFGTVMASSYAFLPFMMMAGLSIFPLTVRELGALTLPLLVVFAIPVVDRDAFMMPTLDAVAVLWLLALVAAVGGLSAISQLQILRSLFATSVIDPLTGTLNRGSGNELIALQFALAQRHGYPLALAFVDLDDFKQVNDTAGHESGDRLLKEAAQAWHATLRKSDTILRWGGEEFVLVLPYTDCHHADHLIRHRLPALRRPDGTPLTFSIGVAEWRADGVTRWQALVALADERMYQAKTMGKNAIVTCAPGAPLT
ncbi:GGDEF domain-containing protein [Acidiferrobacter sp. SPIII_3]|uniref:GGDEF domain-containing protein n=1 Tax=Acidiferrobacter sp. SPIII_3 TaxID=1281578 RepID=UPI000D725C10|nr:diguanylate cyclase [Acidiferrobacter sp. SPIII_3]AWP24173.1 GGDEF domain-containing protein [Acidiferrobacter sp. SPIII_3]